ncbi:MAG: hypothetical protein HQL41_08975 [Alphaproteobacteria bacterium]|nr:hypothetical protein [Alphaproteobacteria bacterium]
MSLDLKIDFKQLPKKLQIALAVIAFDVLFFLFGTGFIDGLLEEYQGEERAARGRVETAQKDTRTAEQDLKMVQDNRQRYESIVARGMIGDQNRLAAVRLLETLREIHRIRNLDYQFEPAATVASTGPETKDYEITRTNVMLDFQAVIDADVFEFARRLDETFPGAVVVNAIKISRVGDPSDEILKAVAEGDGVTLVKGTLGFAWRTANLKPQAANK